MQVYVSSVIAHDGKGMGKDGAFFWGVVRGIWRGKTCDLALSWDKGHLGMHHLRGGYCTSGLLVMLVAMSLGTSVG